MVPADLTGQASWGFGEQKMKRLMALALMMTIISPAHAQRAINRVGCASGMVPMQQTGAAWRQKLKAQPYRATWRQALTNWGDAAELTRFQCLMLLRLQRASGTYQVEEVPYEKQVFEGEIRIRSPDWLTHARLAGDETYLSEAVAILTERRRANDPIAWRQGGTAMQAYYTLNAQLNAERKGPLPTASASASTADWPPRRLFVEGLTWLEFDNYNEAEIYVRRSIARGNMEPRVGLSHGFILYRLGRAQDARAAFQAVARSAGGMDAEIAEFWVLFLTSGVR